MRQALHIFCKDARRLWAEVVISFAALALFVYRQPRTWLGRGLEFGFREYLTPLTYILVFAIWAFLLTRIVQLESLVGDRQLWITRPYRWPQLLFAKLLFVIIFVSLPSFIVDIVLLRMAQFPIGPHIHSLLWLQLDVLVFFSLACLAFAAMTRTVAQMALAIVLALLFAIAIAFLSDRVGLRSTWSGYDDNITAALFIVGCAAVLLLQYARRRTASARLLAVAVAILIALIGLFPPDDSWHVLRRDYRQVAWSSAPVQLKLDPVPPKMPMLVDKVERQIEISLPLVISGTNDKVLVKLDGTILTIDAPDGRRWSSRRKNSWGTLLPGQRRLSLNFTIPARFLKGVQDEPVDLSIQTAFTLYRATDSNKLEVPPVPFRFDNSICFAMPFRSQLQCRQPLDTPRAFVVRLDPAESTCPRDEETPLPPEAIAWDTVISEGETGDPLSPVATYSIRPSFPQGTLDDNRFPRASPGGICAGTRVTVSRVTASEKIRAELRIPAIMLRRYRMSNTIEGFLIGVGAR